MDHNDIRHKLSEYLDGSVTHGVKTAIEEHLKTCIECSDALRELRKTIEHIHAVDEVIPPPWMTQKIMAKVREEADTKKGLFRRLFYPLAVKLPIQAVAMLFLTVTVYYIYSGMHPSEKYTEAPMERLAKQEAPAEFQDAAKRRTPEISAEREKKVAQEPGYKSLDMKYEYEKPAPPVPQEQPAVSSPAPAKRAGQDAITQEERTGMNRSMAPRAAAPSSIAKQAAPAAGAALSREAEHDAGKSEGKANAFSAADKDADATLEVTEYFVRKDLPEKMKVKGLQFSTRKILEDTPGLEWLRDMSVYRTKPCGNRFLVDVEAAGRSFKYLYCYDGAGTRLLGILELSHGMWLEKK